MNVQRVWKIAGRILFRLYFRVRVVGRAHLPSEGGFIVAPNHVSNLDPPLVGVEIRRYHTTLGKRELFRSRFTMVIFRQWGGIPVDRGHPGRELVADLVERLRAGGGLLLFPEGTRSRTGRLGEAHRGIALLALAAGVPIIPTFVAGSRRAMPPGSYFPRPRRITVTFGAPIWPEDFTHRVDRHGRPVNERRVQKELTDAVMAAIRGLAEEQGVEV
jgi:1-acyl-sn-glycerol-3-phosphate acyltransferase